MKKLLPLVIGLIIQCQFVNAQQWFQDMYNPSVNFFTVQQEFNNWWDVNKEQILSEPHELNGPVELEGNWVIYKRWEHEMLPLMLATGGVRGGAFDSIEFKFNQQRNAAGVTRSGSTAWNYIGPVQGFTPGGVVGCKGRLNCVRFDPVDSATIYVGAPSGGIWKTVDGGQSWVLLNTDTLTQIGVTDIAINPLDNQNIFIATGDFANAANLSIGVLQSTDGGTTWQATGLTWTISEQYEISRLLMDPGNPDILIAATNKGIYRTLNGGSSWTRVGAMTNISSMEFKPGNTSVVYACNTRVYRSLNEGTSWNTVTTGLPTSTTVNALAIGVTPADTNCVYVLASSSAQSNTAGYNPIGGLYRSEDAGGTFALQSVASQVLTQGVYDLTVGVSPINSDELVIGAETTAFSNDGGLTFNYPNVDAHVDHHDIRFLPNSENEVYSADDGGLFVSTDNGDDWTGINNGLNIGQIYIVAPSGRTAELDMTGRQDDGTLLQLNSTANSLAPGDGTNCVIDPTSDSIMYGSIETGLFARSTNFGQSYSIIVNNFTTGVNGPGEWVTPFVLNPKNHNALYMGKDFIYKSPNQGNSWNALNSPALSSGTYWHYIAISAADTNYIYACTGSEIVRSADGGATFKIISIAGNNREVWSLAVSDHDPLKVWAATSGGVYMSGDTGHTWTNISTGLPAATVYYPYSIAYLNHSPDALYLGLFYGGGVYYIDSTLSEWQPFGTGLPNTSAENLQISYAAGTVRAATYGRDLWEIPLYNNWYNPPVAEFQTGVTCTSQPVQFSDVSSFSPATWQWSFPGGNPSSSTDQNPSVSYTSTGTYYATLTATNAYGSNTVTRQVDISTVCTGVNKIAAESPVNVYPNPAEDLLIAESDAFLEGKTFVQIYDMTGRLIDAPVEYEGAKIELHIANLAEGVYALKLQNEGNSFSKIFVKTRWF